VLKQRETILLVVLVLGIGGLAAPVAAKDPTAKQAQEELEFGYKAAKRGYWQEALERFQIADELTPNQPQILNNIAVALEANGRHDEARTTYQAALALDPGNTRLQKNYQRFQEFYSTFVTADGDRDSDRLEPAGESGGEGGDDDEAPEEQHHES
jgi:tetratricopeptide (TPR) repeat protein